MLLNFNYLRFKSLKVNSGHNEYINILNMIVMSSSDLASQTSHVLWSLLIGLEFPFYELLSAVIVSAPSLKNVRINLINWCNIIFR